MNKKQLYENILVSVAKDVKKTLNKNDDLSLIPIDACMEDCELHKGFPSYSEYRYFGDCVNTVDEDHMWDATQMYYFINGCKIIDPKYTKDIFAKLTDGDRELISSGFGVIYDIEEENKIEDLSEIVCAIDDYQKILVIYITRKDKHYFFDCIK